MRERPTPTDARADEAGDLVAGSAPPPLREDQLAALAIVVLILLAWVAGF